MILVTKCLQCGEEVYSKLEECHVFKGPDGKFHLVDAARLID